MTLKSRVIRAAVAEARIRTIDINPLTSDEKEWKEKGWMGLASKLLGKAWKVVWKFLSKLSITDIVGKIFAAGGFVYNFNWNISEKEIKSAIDGALVRMAGLLGSGAGKIIGSVSAGAIAYGACLVIFPGAVAALLGRKIASEIVLQLVGELSLIIKMLFLAAFQAGALWLYGKAKQAIKGSDKDFIAKLKKKGLKTEEIQKAMAERDKPFTLRGKVEEFKEWLGGNSAARKAFSENLIDDAQGSFVEAGYVAAGIMDEYLAATNHTNILTLDFQEDGTVKVTS